MKLNITNMANGGAGIGRDYKNRVIFVPHTIPGERVEADIEEGENKKYANGRLRSVISSSPDRVTPRCAHFEQQTCSHFQHIDYPRQLTIKQEVAQEQLKRLGGIDVRQPEIVPSPHVWGYAHEVTLSPAPDDSFGFWSAAERNIVPVDVCHLLAEPLQNLMRDFDLNLPGLRKMRLRIGFDESPLVALETQDMEPPSIQVDFPVSIALVLPDQTTANLIGDNFVVQQLGERRFQVSAGCFFRVNPTAVGPLLEGLLDFAHLSPHQQVVELFSGVGTLTASLASQAAAVHAIEANADAVGDLALNLDDTENVYAYQGFVEDVLPNLEVEADVIVLEPPDSGISAAIVKGMVAQRPRRIIYISHDIASLARDGKLLSKAGYSLKRFKLFDMEPHTYRSVSLSMWGR